MNALNVTVVGQLTQAVADANADEAVHTIVVDGAGKAFVAGADVKFFVDKIRADAIPEIYDFTADVTSCSTCLRHPARQPLL